MLVPEYDNLEEAHKQVEEALEVIYRCGQIDGSHHKMWVIDQVVRKLMTEEHYAAWVEEYESDPEYEDAPYQWDAGIAP